MANTRAQHLTLDRGNALCRRPLQAVGPSAKTHKVWNDAATELFDEMATTTIAYYDCFAGMRYLVYALYYTYYTIPYYTLPDKY